jgi:predicted transposase/invertase (TIGR01784 family)
MTKLVRFDWAIKFLLRNKANFDILEGFLSELLKKPVIIEQILDPEGNKEHAKDKYNRVDVLATTNNNEKVIIEVQCTSQCDYLSRVLYGTSKIVCNHLREGDKYSKLPKVISVSVVFFDLGEGKDYLYHGTTDFRGIHCNDLLQLNPREQQMYGKLLPDTPQTPQEIFPEYYLVKVAAFKEQVKDKFDEWIYFLKNDKIKKTFTAQGIQSAMEKLNFLRLNEKQRSAYSAYQTGLHDDASFMAQMEILQEEKDAQLKMLQEEKDAQLKTLQKEKNAQLKTLQEEKKAIIEEKEAQLQALQKIIHEQQEQMHRQEKRLTIIRKENTKENA